MTTPVQKSESTKDRAIYLLRVAAQFIKTNRLESHTYVYDEAECDGGCLAGELIDIADDLEEGRS